jgi:Ca2+/Na+ antiporter
LYPSLTAVKQPLLAYINTHKLYKLALFLGGAIIGSFVAILALRFGTAPLLKRLTNEQVKKQVLSYRKIMTWWIIFGGVLLTISDTFTQGWWGPVSAYIIFAGGLMYQVKKTHRVVEQALFSEPTINQKELRNRKFQRLCGFWGNILGVSCGFFFLILGLVNSARLTFS